MVSPKAASLLLERPPLGARGRSIRLAARSRLRGAPELELARCAAHFRNCKRRSSSTAPPRRQLQRRRRPAIGLDWSSAGELARVSLAKCASCASEKRRQWQRRCALVTAAGGCCAAENTMSQRSAEEASGRARAPASLVGPAWSLGETGKWQERVRCLAAAAAAARSGFWRRARRVG